MDGADLPTPGAELIKKELREAMGTLIAGCESLDTELAFGAFADSPDFLMMSTDGSLSDHRKYVDDNISYLTTCSDFKLTTFREEIRVLDERTAVFAWAYGAEATLQTGAKDVVEKAGASFVFRKVGDDWRVVYYHESSLPPVRVEANSR